MTNSVRIFFEDADHVDGWLKANGAKSLSYTYLGDGVASVRVTADIRSGPVWVDKVGEEYYARVRPGAGGYGRSYTKSGKKYKK